MEYVAVPSEVNTVPIFSVSVENVGWSDGDELISSSMHAVMATPIRAAMIGIIILCICFIKYLTQTGARYCDGGRTHIKICRHVCRYSHRQAASPWGKDSHTDGCVDFSVNVQRGNGQ